MQVFERAHQKLQSYTRFEIWDQKDILVNLSKGILDHSISPRSVWFNMISTMIRGWLNLQPNGDRPKEGAYVFIKDKEIQISQKEKELLKHLKINELLLNMLTGKIDGWMQNMMRSGTEEKKPQSDSHEPSKLKKLEMAPPSPVNVHRRLLSKC